MKRLFFFLLILLVLGVTAWAGFVGFTVGFQSEWSVNATSADNATLNSEGDGSSGGFWSRPMAASARTDFFFSTEVPLDYCQDSTLKPFYIWELEGSTNDTLEHQAEFELEYWFQGVGEAAATGVETGLDLAVRNATHNDGKMIRTAWPEISGAEAGEFIHFRLSRRGDASEDNSTATIVPHGFGIRYQRCDDPAVAW